MENGYDGEGELAKKDDAAGLDSLREGQGGWAPGGEAFVGARDASVYDRSKGLRAVY